MESPHESDVLVSTGTAPIYKPSSTAERLLLQNRGYSAIVLTLDDSYAKNLQSVDSIYGGFILEPGDQLELTKAEDGDLVVAPIIGVSPGNGATMHIIEVRDA